MPARRGSIVDQLLAAGWHRDNYTPADSVSLCGCISEDPTGTGECYHVARWTKPPMRGNVLCAQHALLRQQREDYSARLRALSKSSEPC